MIAVAYPGLLVGGALLAGVPLLLHLLARTPPSRAPLPTARFLTQDARTLLRLRRRPTDIPLLLVRMAFVAVLAAGLAGLTWSGARSGAVQVLLVDAGADPDTDWAARVAATDRWFTEPGPVDPATERVVIAYGLDAGHRVISPEALDRVVRGAERATAQDGLRALRAVVGTSRWATAEAVMFTTPSWRAWSPDDGLLRARIWPGHVALAGDGLPATALERAGETTATARADGATATRSEAVPVSAWIYPEAVGTHLESALEALGVRALSGADAGSNPDWILAHDPTPAAATAFVERAREGSAVVLSGLVPADVDELPWVPGDVATASSGLVLPWGDGPIGKTVVRTSGAPTPGARVVAVFEDGLPAAAARAVGRGCVTYLAADLLDASLTASPAYPLLLENLATGCDAAANGGPLDRGALYALERPDLPSEVDVASLGDTGTPLTRWLLIFAFVLLLAEVGLTRERAP